MIVNRAPGTKQTTFVSCCFWAYSWLLSQVVAIIFISLSSRKQKRMQSFGKILWAGSKAQWECVCPNQHMLSMLRTVVSAEKPVQRQTKAQVISFPTADGPTTTVKLYQAWNSTFSTAYTKHDLVTWTLCSLCFSKCVLGSWLWHLAHGRLFLSANDSACPSLSSLPGQAPTLTFPI